MKITFVYGSLGVGGAERVIAYLANRFVEKGHRVSIVLFSQEPPVYELNNEIQVIQPNKVQNGNSIAARIEGFLLRTKYIRKNIKNADCVVAFDPFLALFAKFSYPKAKVIGSERTNPNLRKNDRRESLAMKYSYLLNGFIFQTEGAKNCYPKRTQKKSVVIPNGIFVNYDNALLDYDQRKKVVCASGRLMAGKRYDVIIKSFSEIIDKHNDYRLRIFGIGKLKSDIENMILQYDLSDYVDMMGWSDNISAELSKSRIFVLASDYEGMPNGLIEAMACGCACISTDCDFGPAEIIENKKDGILVNVGNVDEMAEALDLLMSDTDLAVSYSKNAMEKIQKDYDPNKITEKIYQYISMICRKEA